MSYTDPNNLDNLKALSSKVLSHRERVDVKQDILNDRLDNVMPKIMEAEGFDMWLVAAREYNEDPIMKTLLPAPMKHARRTTLLVYVLEDGEVNNLALARYDIDLYDGYWNPDEKDQYQALNDLIKEKDPEKIGINVSDNYGLCDGLSRGEYLRIEEALDDKFVQKFESAENLGVRWLETRSEKELEIYPGIVDIAHGVIDLAFSSSVIHPGITTTEDVSWWMVEAFSELGLEVGAKPTIDLQAPDMPWGESDGAASFDEQDRDTILSGDIIRCDTGFSYLGLNTDIQQNVYILDQDESDVPDGFKRGLSKANRLQDILADNMELGLSGNQILENALAEAEDENLNATIYAHPIGFYDHEAGPSIGLWDQQEGVPGKGDSKLHDNTAFAIELNVRDQVEEWDGQVVRFPLEEEAAIIDGDFHWISGRQTKFHTV